MVQLFGQCELELVSLRGWDARYLYSRLGERESNNYVGILAKDSWRSAMGLVRVVLPTQILVISGRP